MEDAARDCPSLEEHLEAGTVGYLQVQTLELPQGPAEVVALALLEVASDHAAALVGVPSWLGQVGAVQVLEVQAGADLLEAFREQG